MPTGGIFLISCDTHTLTGSRGDEAMMTAIVDRVHTLFPAHQIIAAVSAPIAKAAASSRGFAIFPVWGRLLMPLHFWNSVRRHRPFAAVLMGADIMDGYYSPVEALRRLIAADVLARSGVPVALLGFSLNSGINPLVVMAFRCLHRDVRLMLRDPISLQRLREATGDARRGILVADTAFLLKPADNESLPATRWIAEQRSMSRTVLAVNVHPLLFPPLNRSNDIHRLCRALAGAMAEVSTGRQLSWLLLPHDDRPKVGDIESMSLLEQELAGCVLTWHNLKSPPDAATVKGLVAGVDGVVTGRMHLAIASFGSGVPVMALAYQGKFEGLMHHFEMPHWVKIDPACLGKDLDKNTLAAALSQFVDALPVLAKAVRARNPTINELAEKNFSGLVHE